MIETVFANEGPLAVLDGYRMRPDQVALACAVERALDKRTHLVAEAPTGVGKSFAYLVPATQRSTRGGEGGKTLIVTPTKSLQDQLIDKDLPTLQRILPWRFKFALLKGRSNYLCLAKMRDPAERDKLSPEDLADVARATSMLKVEPTGEIDRLGVDLSIAARMSLSCSSDDCTFGKCPHYKLDTPEPCYVSQARARAAEADLVVANYHLLLWDVRLGGLVLPDFDSIVFDEAHELPKVARGFFDDLFSPRSVRRACAGLTGDDGKALLGRVLSRCNAMFDEVAQFVGVSRLPLRVRRGLPINWEPMRDALNEVVDFYSAKLDRDPDNAKAEKRRDQALHLVDRMFDLVTSGDLNRVYWIEETRRGDLTLNSRVIDVSDYLREQVFDRWPSVLTSATLSVGGRIDHFARETGVPEPEFLEVGSPFDWKRQARFVIDDAAPDPSKEREEFDRHVEDRFVEIVRTMGGRTLGLLTSRRMLDRVHARLSRERFDFPILKQGTGSLARIVDEFKRDVDSCLLGVQSLWQGIDAPGETCSCVVIDKLPFPMPGDPLLDALKDKLGRDYFSEEVIPRMVIPLKQGFGRAVRRVDDRCVIVLLDPRPLSKSYGRILFDSLPPVPRARSLAVLDDFFNRPESEL